MEDLREFHAALLEILVEFDRICRGRGLKYSLAYGTLLGAVRHKGFIPWDDDVDVMMERRQFDEFCRIAPEALGGGFFLQSRETEEKYPYNLVRIRKNDTAMIYDAWRKSGIHLGVYIDIYPVDRIPDNPFLRQIQRLAMILCTPVRIAANPVIFATGGRKFNQGLKRIVGAVARVCPRKQFSRWERRQLTKYKDRPCRKCGIICEGGLLIHTTPDMMPFDSSTMDRYRDVDFEGHRFMSVADCESMLVHWYGDWKKLPPLEERTMYHHPDVFSTTRSYKEFI